MLLAMLTFCASRIDHFQKTSQEFCWSQVGERERESGGGVGEREIQHLTVNLTIGRIMFSII